MTTNRSASAAELRGAAARSSNAITMIVLGAFAVAGAFGAFAALRMTPDAVAQAESGVLLVVVGIVWLVQRRGDMVLEAKVAAREAKAHREGLLLPQPALVHRHGARGEGGVLLDGEDTEPPDRGDRVSREG